MSWSKFHFNCRFLHQKISEEVDLEKAKELLLTKYSNNQIGGDLKENSIEDNLFKNITLEPDPKKLQILLSIYGKLNLSWDLSDLTKLINIRNYLFALFTVFLFISSIYKYFVLPEFINIFGQMGIPISAELERFDIIWFISFTIMLLISIVLFKFYSFVNHIGQKENYLNSSLFSRIFIPAKIISKLKLIDALSNAPMENQVNEFSTEQINICNNFKSDDLDVSVELQTLLNVHRASLLKLINMQITKLLALFSVAVIAAIGYLILGIYQPIFSLGMII